MGTIYFIGGCHVEGYLVGLKNAFSTLTIKALNWTGNTYFSPPTSTSKALRFLKEIESSLSNSDLVVLQLGNLETSLSFLSMRKSMPQSRRAIHDIKKIDENACANRFGKLLSTVVKLLLLKFYDRIGKSRFDILNFEKTMLEIFDLLNSRNVGQVVVLSPFYSLQPHINIYRARASSLLNELSDRYGFLYIDVCSDVKNAKRKNFFKHPTLIDAEHLNKFGHQIVSEIIVKNIKKVP